MNSNTPQGVEIRKYYLKMEQYFINTYKKQHVQLEADAAQMKGWYEQTSELLDTANGQLTAFNEEIEFPQRVLTLPKGTSPNSKCMETSFGREIVRKTVHDIAIILWEDHQAFEHRHDACYWNSLVMVYIGCDPQQKRYTSHINLLTAFYQAIKKFYGVVHSTHISYNQLYQITKRLARNGLSLVQKADLQQKFGNTLDKYEQTNMEDY